MNICTYDFKSFSMRLLNSKLIKGQDLETGRDTFALNRLQSVIINNILKYKDLKPNAHKHVIAVDGNNYWRKSFFPQYKFSRIAKKLSYNLDWDEFESHCESALQTLTEMGFVVLKFDDLEADDVIAMLVLSTKHKFIIFSGDLDYYQLCENPNVFLYNTRDDVFVKKEISPKEFLYSSIFMGQKKDDIPNIITPLDFQGSRQPGFGPKAWDKVKLVGMFKWLEGQNNKIKVLNNMSNVCNYPLLEIKNNNAYERYVVNRILVDMKLVQKKGYGDQVLNSSPWI